MKLYVAFFERDPTLVGVVIQACNDERAHEIARQTSDGDYALKKLSDRSDAGEGVLEGIVREPV